MERVLLAILLTLAMVHVGSGIAYIKDDCTDTMDTVYVEGMDLTANSPCNTTLRQVFTILDETENNLLVGSTECLYAFNKISTTWSSVSLPMNRPEDTICPTIQSDGISVDFLCRNYIRLGFELNSTTFRVCGTYNRQNPQCWVCTRNNENLSCKDGEPTSNMPSDPIRNHTAQLINDGTEDFFFVTSRDSFTNEDVQFSTVNALTGNEHIHSYDGNGKAAWLNTQEQSVDFVGEPIEYGPHIYFFFRERALEYYLPGNVIYSRVARICKNDTGGQTNPLREQFTTYLKTRLICSSGTDYPFIYDSIQDVKQAVYSNNIMYALFTTSRFRQSSTAICRYDLREMNTLFSTDQRRGQASSNSLWTAIPFHSSLSSESSERSCDTPAPQNVATYNYLRDYPLLNTNAQNCGLGETCDDYTRDAHEALAVLEGIRGQQIAVVSDSNDHIDAYIGTNYKMVYKISITSTEALIKEKVKISSEDLSPEEVNNKYPYAVSSLEARDEVVYGTLDNCVFKLTMDQNSSANATIDSCVKDRTSQDVNIANHTINIPGAVTNFFKIFEAQNGFGMTANFTGDLEGRCNQTLFHSQANNKELLHVHCLVEDVTKDADLKGNITVTSAEGCWPLTVPVTIAIDNSDLPAEYGRESKYMEAESFDQKMAEYRHNFKQWILMNDMAIPTNNTCSSAKSCSYN